MYKDVFHLVLCVLCESLHFTHTSKHLHDCIISPRGQFWGHKTSLIQQLIVEVRVCTKAGMSEVMCLYVRGNDFASFYNYCILEMFWQCGIFSFSFFFLYFHLSLVSCSVLSQKSNHNRKIFWWIQTIILLLFQGSSLMEILL